MPPNSKEPGRSRAGTRANYDRLSPFYDLLAGSSERACRAAGLDLLGAMPGERILEIGPGTGGALPDLAGRLAPDGLVWGLDLSPGMLRKARGRVRRTGIQARTGLAAGDAAAVPFAPGSFDGVFMAFTLELFDQVDIPVVLAECRRVLRPGGRIVAASLGLAARSGLSRGMLALYQWSHRAFPAVVDCRPIEAGLALQQAGFALRAQQGRTLWALPVEIVLAQRPHG